MRNYVRRVLTSAVAVGSAAIALVGVSASAAAAESHMGPGHVRVCSAQDYSVGVRFIDRGISYRDNIAHGCKTYTPAPFHHAEQIEFYALDRNHVYKIDSVNIRLDEFGMGVTVKGADPAKARPTYW